MIDFFEIFDINRGPNNVAIPFVVTNDDAVGQVVGVVGQPAYTYSRDILFFPDQASKVFLTCCSMSIESIDSVTGLLYKLEQYRANIHPVTNDEIWPFSRVGIQGLGLNSYPGSIIHAGDQSLLMWGAQRLGGNACRLRLTLTGNVSPVLVNQLLVKVSVTLQGYRFLS